MYYQCFVMQEQKSPKCNLSHPNILHPTGYCHTEERANVAGRLPLQNGHTRHHHPAGIGPMLPGQETAEEAEDRSQVGGAPEEAQQRSRKQDHLSAAEAHGGCELCLVILFSILF